LKGVENLELDKITKNYLPERVMKKLSDKQMQEFEQNVNNFSNGQL
jgi:succinate dehydrogenase flavin-adding protein (antitoxin of CptAB toxin-antitoxin module)